MALHFPLLVRHGETELSRWKIADFRGFFPGAFSIFQHRSASFSRGTSVAACLSASNSHRAPRPRRPPSLKRTRLAGRSSTTGTAAPTGLKPRISGTCSQKTHQTWLAGKSPNEMEVLSRNTLNYIYEIIYEYFPLPCLIPGRVFWGFKPLQIYLCQFSKISCQIEWTLTNIFKEPTSKALLW